MPDAPRRYSLKSQIAEIERELAQRAEVYPRLIASRGLREAEATMRVEILKAALETLQWLEKNQDAVKAASENNRELWHALRMIREAVEQHAPPGSLPAGERAGPEPAHEAEALVRAIDAIAAAGNPEHNR